MANNESIKEANHDGVVNQVKELEQNGGKKKKKSIYKYLLNISIVLIVTALAIYLNVKDNFSRIVSLIASSNYIWIAVVIGVMSLQIAVRTFVLFIFARLYTRDYTFRQAGAVEFIGTFYHAVTPGGQGGEVMQAYTYKKQGIPISSAVSALAMHSIVFQLVLVFYGIISFIFKYQYINDLPLTDLGAIGSWHIKLPMWGLTIVGFGLNVGYIGLILMMGYWKGFHNFIMGPLLSLFHKIKLCKNPDKTRENLRVQVENFKIEMRRLFSNIPFTVLVALCFFAAFTLKFSIPFFVGKALHNESTCASFWDSVFLSNYHQMVTGLIPIPGSAGVSEAVFRLLYVTNPATPNHSFFYKAATDAQLQTKFLHFLNGTGSLGGHSIESIKDFMTANNLTNILDFKELGVESDFYSVFTAVKHAADTTESNSLASAALLTWRSITFIIPLVIAGFVTAFYRASPKDDIADNKRLPNRNTMVELQRETYSERYQEVETLVETNRLTRESIRDRLKALANSDRRKRRKKKKEEEMKNQNEGYRDVNIGDEDDSL